MLESEVQFDALRALDSAQHEGMQALISQVQQAHAEELRRAAREMAQLLIDHGCDVLPSLPEGLPGETQREEVVRETLAEAERLWRLGIEEPSSSDQRGAEEIDKMIRTGLGLNWTWESHYVRNGQFAWCGAFAATCLAKAGMRQDLRKSIMPSCYRLYENWASTDRHLEPSAVQPGDILVVGPVKTGSKAWGAHITLVMSVEGDVATTFEGNASGPLGDGRDGEGVIKRQRPLSGAGLGGGSYRGLHGYRLDLGDFED